jgi:hypothetical protein
MENDNKQAIEEIAVEEFSVTELEDRLEFLVRSDISTS